MLLFLIFLRRVAIVRRKLLSLTSLKSLFYLKKPTTLSFQLFLSFGCVNQGPCCHCTVSVECCGKTARLQTPNFRYDLCRKSQSLFFLSLNYIFHLFFSPAPCPPPTEAAAAGVPPQTEASAARASPQTPPPRPGLPPTGEGPLGRGSTTGTTSTTSHPPLPLPRQGLEKKLMLI